MRRPATAVAITAILASGLAACGGDASESSDVVPRSTPDLVAPEDTGLPPATSADDTETSTSTTSTETTPQGTDTSAAPVTPTPSAPVTPTPEAAPEAGGQQAPPAETPEPPGSTGGNSGGFSDFCAENPGACPEE